VAGTVDLLEPLGKPMIFLVNSATMRTRITADAAVALSQHGKVAPVIVHHRVDFAVSMIDGRTVGELNPNGNSAQEITGLWAYVNKQLAA
jgi:chromosome partitioning protein